MSSLEEGSDLSVLDEIRTHDRLALAMDSVKASRYLRRLLSITDASTALTLITKAITGPVPAIDDWRNVFRPLSFSFRKSVLFFAVFSPVVVLAIMTSIRLCQTEGYLAFLPIGLLLLNTTSIAISAGSLEDKPEDAAATARLLFLWPLGVIEAMWKAVEFNFKSLAASLFLVPATAISRHIVFCSWFPIVVYYTHAPLSAVAPWYVIAIAWSAFSVTSTSLWIYGFRLQRRARNVLHGIVEPLSISTHERRSAESGETMHLLKKSYGKMPVPLALRHRSS